MCVANSDAGGHPHRSVPSLGYSRHPHMRLALALILVLIALALRAQNSFSPKLTQFLLSPPAASLALSNVFAEASSGRTVQVYYFYTYDESAPNARHHYLGDSSTVGIFVRENQPACDECISILFEVLNSKGEKRFRELWGLAKSGGISKADFVRETQRQEFQAALAARNIIRTFDLKPEEIAASKSYGDFIKTPDDFQAFLARSRKVSQGGNQRAYEELYDRIRTPAKQ
jgi:hypothetical protein